MWRGDTPLQASWKDVKIVDVMVEEQDAAPTKFTRRAGRDQALGISQNASWRLPRTSPSPSTMSAEVFNPNPTIFVTSKARKQAYATLKPHSLWLDDRVGNEEDEYDQSDEAQEVIDQDEIFGTSLLRKAPCSDKSAHIHVYRTHTFYL